MSTTENESLNEHTVHLSIAERFLSTSNSNSQVERSSVSIATGTPSLCSPLSQKSRCDECQSTDSFSHYSACEDCKRHDYIYDCEYKCEYEYGEKKCKSTEEIDINVKHIDEQSDLEKNKKKSRYICRGKPLCAIISFVLIIMITIAAFLLWPRTPLIRIDRATLLSDAKTTEMRHGPINLVAYESGWKIKLIIDNRQNYITTRFNRIKITAKDAMSGSNIGKGQEDSIMLPGNTISSIELPLHINYRTQDPYDTTIMYLQRACNNTKSSDSHIALSVHFSVTLYIFMLEQLNYIPRITAVPATGGFYCP
ncbi:hypothetical protein BY458DRAFT_548940 [Sporodiniella umbellata]|nr:hypothetical protein BY458DRAFT_548940 [Sporodiniella umbellata]